MVESDAFATHERVSRGYGMSDRDRVVKLFTRKNCAVPLEEEAPTKAPKITCLSPCQLEPGYRANAHGFRSGSPMALMPDDGDSSRECLYTPAEAASSSVLPITSPELKLKEFEQELAKLKASRLKQRTALREEVLCGTDIYAGPSTSAVVPKIPAAAVSEHDAAFSVSSRSSEENLPFVDAIDELHEDEEFEDTRTATTDSVDFSFLHSVYRGKGKHEEAILLRMKYAGNKAARARLGDTGALDSASSKSIIGASAAETDAKIQEFLRGTLLNWDSRPPALENAPSPGTGSVSASGSTTPQQRCRDGSRDSSVPTSKRTSRTSVETRPSTIAPLRSASLPQTQSKSSLASSPSGSSSSSLPLRPRDVSRTPSSPSQISETEYPVLPHQTELHKYPECDSPQSSTYHEYPPSEVSRRSTFNEYPTSESPRHSGYNENPAPESPRLGCDENPTSESPRHSTYEYPTLLPTARVPSKSQPSSTSLDESILPAYDTKYPISECSTEDDWPFRSERSERSSTKTLDIPITIDGRVVFPEVIFAEDVRTTRSLGPLGLLDKVKSFAQSCGLGTQDNEQSPVLQPFTEGFPEGEKPCAKFNAALLSRLTCVICGALCTPPVAMCAWGHVVCEECRPVSLWESQGRCTCRKRCPQCSGNMMSKPCELWSNIARSLLYPCRYTTNGCGESQGLTPAKKQLHEQACVWRQLRCWCPGCSWRGFWHQFRGHVDRVHLPGATRADWYRFVAVSGATRMGRSSDVITLPANELVLLHSLYVIGEHRYLLQYLNDDRGGGAVAIVPRFKLRVTSKDGRSEVEVRGDAVPGQHDVERALRSGKCFRLSGTPFGTNPPGERFPPEEPAVQLCLEKGRLSVS